MSADSKPGNYYVSVMRSDSNARPDYRLLLGPFRNDHAAALAMVDKVRAKAEELDPRASWYAFGTARVPLEVSPVPVASLNAFFPEVAA